jgi:asparagine synthase (glutamine-hydrolysing)
MCGIAGVYEFGRAGGGVSEELLVRMRDSLRHRGPDDAGSWVSPDRRVGLGNRRLAIVDIAGGAQPMFGRNGDVLVFNGEIYNYPTLRRELEAQGVVFETDCDTEVVLRLYELHGPGCVDSLAGMFAFAIWEPAGRRIFFARDRLGEKPFYWTERGGRFVFGSEIKALLEHPAVEPRVRVDAIPEFLANLVTSSPRTLYDGIWKLGAGEAGICDERGVRTWRYWHALEEREPRDIPLAEAAQRVRRLLDQSVHDRLMSDVPVGVLLSGGLDSTTLVALLRERARGLATFSVGFEDHPSNDERAEARRVARHFGTEHHEVNVSQADALNLLTRLVHHQDEPLADPVCIPLHFVCELAAQNEIKVVLAGEGADELFWGYPRYVQVLERWRLVERILAVPRPLRGLLPHVLPGRFARRRELLEQLATGRPWPLHMPLGLTRGQRRVVLGREEEQPAPGWSTTASGSGESRLTRLMFDTQEYEFSLRLPELLLMRIDRFSMANSVEARVPFLDPSLVDFVYRLPLEHKLSHGTTKIVLRRAIEDVVPDWVLARRKQGFSAPVADWAGAELGLLFERLLAGDGLRAYFDVDALRRGVVDARSGRARFDLWPLINFALWHRYWIEGESIDDLVQGIRPAAEASVA